MNALLNLIIIFQDFLFTTLLNQPGLAELSETWVRTNVMGSNAFGFVFGVMLIMNVLHRPATYKFNILWAPRWAQIAMRQLLFFSLIVNPILLFSLLTVGIVFILIYLLFFSRFAADSDSSNPIVSFFS